MSESVRIAAAPEARARGGISPGWAWVIGGLAGLVGLGLGIFVTFVSAVLPRHQELAGRPAASGYLDAFRPLLTTALGGPNGGNMAEINWTDVSSRYRKVWGRTYLGRVSVRQDDQVAYVGQLRALFERVLSAQPLRNGPAVPPLRREDGTLRVHESMTYQVGDFTGNVQIIGNGRGDVLDLIVTTHERYDR